MSQVGGIEADCSQFIGHNFVTQSPPSQFLAQEWDVMRGADQSGSSSEIGPAFPERSAV